MTEETRTIISRPTSSDSVSGITRAHSHILGGAQNPRGWHPELQMSDIQSDGCQEQPRGQEAQFGTVSNPFCRVFPSG
jgi:hypothetical protein